MNKNQLPFNHDEIDKLIQNASTEQLAWLSGYLWGIAVKEPKSLLSESASSISTQRVAEREIPTITILSASQTGHARRVAQALAHDIEQLGNKVKHVHAADYQYKKMEKETFLIIVTSTQGEGEPPDEALAFYKYLFSKKAPNLSQLYFAVLGLGDSSYVNFCQSAKDFDHRLNELGAQRLTARIDADIDYQTTSDHWRRSLLDILAVHLQAINNKTDVTAAKTADVEIKSARYTKENPFLATVNINQKITSRSSDRDIRHIEFDLSDSGIKYQAGDALGVWYQNSDELIAEIFSVTKLSANTHIEINGQSYSLKQALTEKCELTQNTANVVKNYAKLSQNKNLLTMINQESMLHEYCKNTPIIDMLTNYPAKLDAQEFVNILRPLTPRFYSISSAQTEVEDEVHITVNLVQYQKESKKRYGGASYFLSQQKPEEDKVSIFIEPNDNFRLPQDSNTPIIMIAAGTGIAPFRAFLQQRANESSTGKNWLFFGNPHFSSDFLYQIEWQKQMKNGVLSRIDLAWSRDQENKIYIQDKLRMRSEEIWQWLQQGAYVYVCGDAKKMAKAVELTLLNIITEYGKYDTEQANDYLDELRINKRYQRDIY